MQHHPALRAETPVDLRLDVPVEHRWIDVGGVTLHVALAGPERGRPVILLHGFPEAWFGWAHQIGPLAHAGYRVIVPDQRGYNLSEKPAGLDAYRIDRLSGDIAGLARALGLGRWAVAGHDWGAAVAWQLAWERPAGLIGVGILNVPEPHVFQTLVRRPRQALRSWYMGAFQVPVLPERWLALGDGEALARGLVSSSRPGTFPPDVLAWYRRAWRRPGALSGMLAWYRAALQRPVAPPSADRIELPVTILWGEQDRFLGTELVEPSAARCRQARVVRFPLATHWVQHEEPEGVHAALLEHLRALDWSPATGGGRTAASGRPA